MKNILAIVGSAGKHSSNLLLMKKAAELAAGKFTLTLFDGLATLPHFDTDLATENTPEIIIRFRKMIENADGIIVCTPEYIFSIPSRLKNAFEWCVATTIFAGKPAGLITASAQGLKGHEELQLIMKTLEADFTADTTLLIQGIKGKMDADGNLKDRETLEKLGHFILALDALSA